MAVLVEAISVVIRRASISRSYAGGWDAFVAAVPNATLCKDDDIARVGFMSPSEVERYVKDLEQRGLELLEHGKYVDVAIVDQRQGLLSKCDWLEFGRFPMEAGQMSACWFFDGPRICAGVHMKGTSMDISTPSGWQFEGSLSQSFQFIPTTDADGTTQFPSGIQDDDCAHAVPRGGNAVRKH
jgi:hypothetical protein